MPVNPVLEPEFLASFPAPVLVSALLQTAVSENVAFAAWRLPMQENFLVSIGLETEIVGENFQVETAEMGFIMHPFEVSKNNKAFFFKTSLLFESNFRENKFKLLNSAKTPETDTFVSQFHSVLTGQVSTENNWFTAEITPATASRSEFENLVKNGIGFLQKGGAEKVVLSRASQKGLPYNFSPVAGFENLTKQYPNAFICLVSSSQTGTWLGASPEILVLKDKQNIFRTMALAGTQKLASGQKPADAIWRQKEIEEQSMVVRYIISCFKKIRLRDYIETGPRTVAAGNLLHLRSDFCYDLTHGEFPNLTTEMLHLLHPTSAVCGQPKPQALAFIKENENYDRRYYSGYLGPVNVQQETNLFVNLRCLELRENAAILYAGAGITADSEPEKEWQETELKMQTVSAALQILNLQDDTATGY